MLSLFNRYRVTPGWHISHTLCNTRLLWCLPLWTPPCHCTLQPWLLSRWARCHWETLERTFLPARVYKEGTCLSISRCSQDLKTARHSKWTLPTTRPLTVSSANNLRLVRNPRRSWEVADDITVKNGLGLLWLDQRTWTICTAPTFEMENEDGVNRLKQLANH